ncbi:PREDICTED: peripheral-type benzodiazepine receptor-associated protein 1 isoform X1 [Gavialis gangeticus]|uniref:peripheral-type benzodiazepine receptor-associated protein 1 isoform X1 n=1 Tax=Gavialis gangeticus TaxID=94835 RepID=UPI00092E7F95|nr:PREDICTED: peripheral-type benzodiazepine receptor-associated protein 1 isoform X1 [Gavialis gangeticus]XP_019362622.1 PREDICTED: peripheral-type benzodiazepine receptor-associated protein 1 isoform X1 [Gavialis gangeticus]
MEKQEEMKSHAALVQVSAWQSCLSGHGSLVPGAPAVQDTALVTDLQEDGVPLGDAGSRVALHLTPEMPEAGLEEVGHQSVLVISQEGCLWTLGQQNQPVQSLESTNPQCVMEGLGQNPADGSPKNGADYSYLVKQNIKLLSALEELQHRCTSLKEENSLLRKSCFPETEEKVKHLKRKNAELAVIAKRLEERARKLQEANLKVVNAPVAVKGSSLELCKKAFARQRTKDLTEQASALLAKDKQIGALQQECWELQAKLTSGKEGHHCLNLIDFDHLLRESQKEVLRLQRQIALKNFKESLHSSKSSSEGSFSTAAMCLGPSVPMPNACIKDSSKGVQLGKLTLATEAHRKVEPGVLPLGHTCEELENFPLKNALADQEGRQQREQLEFELRKKRKKCENLEHEVRKKHKRCKELELQLEEVQSENVRLAEQNSRLNEKAEWAGQVESENADLKLQVVLVTKERDSAIQTSQGLQTKLENLEQVLKHMRDVAERRQKLEVEHEEALLVLREKQEEVRRLQQAQAEAKREHEGAVQLLEARVRDLEDQCRSQTEQFSLLSQELKHFRLQTGKIDLLTSTLVTCDLPLAPCSSTPQPQGGHWEKDPDVAPASPALQCSKTTNDEGTAELEPLPQISDPAPSVTKIPLPSAAASQKPAKKMESQSSSSKSESMQNSPKSCPTPEVDTASEMEELDVDSVSLIPEPGNQGPAKLQVFLARYSYNPFDGPNENPEAELPLTAGEYIYIYGDMDEDGFFEGELMDGRRGLVPSNFVERVSDDDLMTFLPPELNDLTHSSYHEKSFVSTSTSSGDKSDYSAEETSVSPLPGRLEGDQDEPVSHTAVPYPRKLVLIKQLARSIVVGWEPPLLPAGYPEIQSYNIYVDAELWQNVKSGPQTKAIVEKLDLKTKAYRISVQSVTEQGSSDRLRCTFFVGQDFCIAPTLLKVRNITATSAEVTWLPCNSNYNHAVYLNEEECDTIKPGVYWYTFHNLHPNTQYVAKVETRPPKMLWELPLEKHEQKSAVVHFTTPLAGIPDAPLDVQVELGPSPSILVISWLPVTIDAEGSSNGVRVTGYAVYADGRKVMEVTSPTAGSVLVDLSQLQMFQVCQEVSVRTMSVYGESVDSVPAQISSTLLKASSHCSPPQSAVSTTSTSKLLCGESRYSLPVQTPVTYQTAPPFPPQKVSTDAKFTIYTTSSCEGSIDSLPEKMSLCLHPSSPSASSMQVTGTLSSMSDASREEECLTDLPQSASNMFPAGMSEEELVASRNPAVKGSGEDSQAEVMVELFVMKNLELESQTNTSNMKVPVETCQACFAEEWLKESTTERGREGTEKCSSPEPQLSSNSAKLGEDSYRDLDASGSYVQELLGMSPGKKLMKEISRGDSSVTVPRVKREQEEKMSEAGRRQLNILAEHSRSSDLSDILEEEEEELCSDVLEEKWDLKEHCSRENGEKQEPCDTDSDEEILERILELPLQKNCSKKLFSIPEVTEEEDEGEEEEEEKQAQVEEREPQDYFLERLPYHAGKEEVPISTVNQQLFPKTDDSDIYQNLPSQAPQEESILQDRGEDTDNENPGSPEPSWGQKRGSCNWSYQESSMRPTTGASPLWGKRKGGSYQERVHDRPEATRKRQSDAREHCSRLLGNCSQTGGSLYRVQSLREKLNVISAGGKDGLDIGSHMRQGSFRKSHRKLASSRLAESASMASRCISSRSLEIDIEYDSEEEQDLTFSPMHTSQLWPNCKVEEPQAHRKEWSVCSSQSEPALSNSRRELNRQEPVEDKGAEWAGSSSHCIQFPSREETPRSMGSSEEQGWELECKLPSLRRKPEHPRKGSHGASLHTRASGNGEPRSQELPGLPSWQSSTRKGSKNLRRSQVSKPPISSTDATRNAASEATVKEDSVRIFVALFDYDPVSMSPNPDAAEEELPFKEGQILKVCGDKDADGFYRGECAGKAGYIPCNMVSEVQVENNDTKKQLLKQGYIPPGTSVESVAELDKQENYKPHPTENYRPRSVHKCQDLEAELLVPRSMVAVFDYNPKESSPNVDVEGLELSWLTSKAELTFSAGDIITVFGSMDDDGFYYGELNRQRGLVPSNFLEAVSLDGGVSEGLHSKDKDACAVSVESQLNLDGPGDLSANTFEVPPSCPVTGVPSPEQVVLETPESSVLPVQTKKKRGFFFKGKQLFRKLGSSKKN